MNPSKIILCSALLLGPHVLARAAASNMSPEVARDMQIDIDKRKKFLDEYHQGKRDDRDGCALLNTLLLEYGQLGKKDAPEVQTWKKELDALKKKHPEFVKNPPTLIHEQIEATGKERKHQAEVAEKAKGTFVPKDSMSFDVYGYDHHAVVQYQHHLDFFELLPPLTLKRERPSPLSPLKISDEKTGRLIHHGKISDLGLKPFRVLTFRHRIDLSRSGPMEWRFIWTCDDLLAADDGSSDEESEIIHAKYPHGLHWLDESAQYSDFCGAIGLDGQVIYQLPIKQHEPDTLFKVGPTTPDGTTVLVSVGEKGDYPGLEPGAAYVIHNIRQVLLWTYPDKLQSFNAKEADKINAVLKAHGWNLSPYPWP